MIKNSEIPSKPLHSETWIETELHPLTEYTDYAFETTPFRNLD